MTQAAAAEEQAVQVCSNKDLHALFAKYADAILRQDMDAVLECVHLPVMIRWPEGTLFVRTREDLAQQNQQLFDQHSRMGVTRVEYAYARGRMRGSRFASGAVTWTTYGKGGQPHPSFEVAYTLECHDGSWLISTIDVADRVALGRQLGW